ncbi:hypothetical protein DY000_02032971 [Brassica cretica]|uniref:Uncharacterized protein n=1 Tax=Brassica cretica TaxID=69181 RepID=A0ABQ7DKG3_BRACR|nr:hypothetical protein DY000_02032971 [Brassica cretica]
MCAKNAISYKPGGFHHESNFMDSTLAKVSRTVGILVKAIRTREMNFPNQSLSVTLPSCTIYTFPPFICTSGKLFDSMAQLFCLWHAMLLSVGSVCSLDLGRVLLLPSCASPTIAS